MSFYPSDNLRTKTKETRNLGTKKGTIMSMLKNFKKKSFMTKATIFLCLFFCLCALVLLVAGAVMGSSAAIFVGIAGAIFMLIIIARQWKKTRN